jgi:beta-galactosidase GanA
MKSTLLACLFGSALLAASALAQAPDIPRLERRGQAIQLIVDGKPFLARAAELHNSSATSRSYMAPLWAKLNQMNVNTTLAAVPWNVIERQEGKFDFTMVDNLVTDARTNNQRLVLLWFGSWKNGRSDYAPEWVKRDSDRFPRILTRTGHVEVLTPLNEASADADARAFAALMRHVREIDGRKHTVIMMQVENEVGLLGDSRDRSPLAKAAFAKPVPDALIARLQQNKDHLREPLRRGWENSNYRTAGSWADVFGAQADEAFMAWHYARYLDKVAGAGKKEYPLPMFVNTWIVQPEDKGPGDYPSGGPQAHSHDIWRAGAPNIDILAPDIYLPDFAGISAQYYHPDTGFFVPESASGNAGAANAFIAVGRYNAIGYSPFGMPQTRTGDAVDANETLGVAFGVLRDIAPIVLAQQSSGGIAAASLSANRPAEEIALGGYKLTIKRHAERRSGVVVPSGYALILATGPDEFLVAGSDIEITFASDKADNMVVGLADVEEGTFANRVWKPGRNLSGDEIMISYDQAAMAAQSQTGSGLIFAGQTPTLQKVRLYRFPHGIPFGQNER